ncbi:MAG TPA: RNA polymerase sigma factor [Phycisphaerae bacterium]|nr:RNA polymerase sigma factor [Phycisphaerae bacterium]
MDDPTEQLGELYRQEGPVIWAYAARHFRDRHDADEVLQETFLAAAQNMTGLGQASSKRAWLLGIARNTIRHRSRKLRRQRETGWVEQHAAPKPAHEVDDRLDRMREAIRQLPDAQRETLELRLVEELSYSETAEVMGIPIGTVRSRLHDAVRRIRELVSERTESGIGAP